MIFEKLKVGARFVFADECEPWTKMSDLDCWNDWYGYGDSPYSVEQIVRELPVKPCPLCDQKKQLLTKTQGCVILLAQSVNTYQEMVMEKFVCEICEDQLAETTMELDDFDFLVKLCEDCKFAWNLGKVEQFCGRSRNGPPKKQFTEWGLEIMDQIIEHCQETIQRYFSVWQTVTDEAIKSENFDALTILVQELESTLGALEKARDLMA